MKLQGQEPLEEEHTFTLCTVTKNSRQVSTVPLRKETHPWLVTATRKCNTGRVVLQLHQRSILSQTLESVPRTKGNAIARCSLPAKAESAVYCR